MLQARTMSLRSRMVLILSAVVLLYAGLDHVTQRVLVAPSFSELEREEAREDLRRVVESIDREVRQLDLRCLELAGWDPIAAFADEPASSWLGSYLEHMGAQEDRVDLVFVCRTGGEVAWARVRGLAEGERLRFFPSQALAPSHPLLAENTPSGREHAESGRAAGLLMTERGPMLVASRPIMADGGPARGTLILGRFMDGDLLAQLVEQVSVRFEWWPLDSPHGPAAETALRDEITSSPEAVIRARSEQLLDVYTTIPDIQAAPALLLRAELDRKITARGATAIRYALISTLAAGLLLLLVLLQVLQGTVLRPIARLTEHAVLMGRREDPSVKLDLDRGDEIGVLSREFDDMIEKLARSRAAVVQAARSAGQSEIATGILHNVGNVLNSVNVSATLVAERVRDSKLAKLQRLAQVADEHGQALGSFLANDPRGKHFGPYLSELARLMARDQETIAKEVEALSSSIGHIRELVDSQQAYARRTEFTEPTLVQDQIEAALKISASAAGAGGPVEIVRDYEDLPAVLVDKHRLLEILVNLAKNARQSLQRAQTSAPRLQVALRRAGAEQLRIEVTDNGAGIPAHLLTRIFHHGFTTHADGHGFGLHGSANAATEMGGTLTARSEGEGRGATFILELPCRMPVAC